MPLVGTITDWPRVSFHRADEESEHEGDQEVIEELQVHRR